MRHTIDTNVLGYRATQPLIYRLRRHRGMKISTENPRQPAMVHEVAAESQRPHRPAGGNRRKKIRNEQNLPHAPHPCFGLRVGDGELPCFCCDGHLSSHCYLKRFSAARPAKQPPCHARIAELPGMNRQDVRCACRRTWIIGLIFMELRQAPLLFKLFITGFPGARRTMTLQFHAGLYTGSWCMRSHKSSNSATWNKRCAASVSPRRCRSKSFKIASDR